MLVGVMTINEKEREAIQEALRGSGFRRVDSQDMRLHCTVDHWFKGVDGVLLINNKTSGNLIAALIAQAVLVGPRALEFDAWVLFGCAGLLPRSKTAPAKEKWPALGDTVVVNEATYIENGVVSQNATTLQEEVRLKGHKFSLCTTNPSAGYSRLFKPSLERVKAACVDKIIRLPPNSIALTTSNDSNELHYASALRDSKAKIIDMETYGFMNAIGDVRSDRTIVFRVLTDELTDQGESAQVSTDDSGERLFTPKQLDYLRFGALDFAEFISFLKSQEFRGQLPQSWQPTEQRSEQVLRIFSEGMQAVRGSIELTYANKGPAIRELAKSMIPKLIEEFELISEKNDFNDDQEMRYLTRGLSIFAARGYGSELISIILSSKFKRALGTEFFYNLSSKTREDKSLMSPNDFAQAFVRGVNPRIFPVTSVKAFINYYFGEEIVQMVLAVKRDPESDTVVIRPMHSERHQSATNVRITFARNHSVGAAETSDRQIFWTGFDQDAELAGAISAQFNVSVVPGSAI